MSLANAYEYQRIEEVLCEGFLRFEGIVAQ